MKNTTIGVDSSLNSSSSTVTIDEVTADSTNNVAFTTEQRPDVPILARPENTGIVCQVTNGIVTPCLQVLLHSVLGAIDASIPNKEQNRAVKHIVRKQFDDAYLNICRLAYPDMNMGASGGEYYLEPNAKAFSQGTIRA